MGLFGDIANNTRITTQYKPSCDSCKFSSVCTHTKFLAKEKQGYLFLAGVPTTSQEQSEDAWVGSYADILLPILKKNNVSMDKVSFCFAVPHNMVKISELSNLEYDNLLSSCKDNLKKCIEKADPVCIIPCDQTAWDILTKDYLSIGRNDKATFTEDFAFHLIPDQTWNRWFAPILSPKKLNKMSFDRGTGDDAQFYLRRMRKFLEEVFATDLTSFPDYKSKAEEVHICNTTEDALEVLHTIAEREPKYLAFDFETEGLKLERTDLNIVCVGLSCSFGTFSMTWEQNNKEFTDAFREIMLNRNIGKIAHHAKYEARCCLNKLGVLPTDWAWDSMYGAKILYNREKCGLKPQVYMHFGIAGYDAIEWTFESESKEEEERVGENRRNKLLSAYQRNYKGVRDKALQYVGEDALYTRLLALYQMEQVSKDTHTQHGEQLFRSYINPLVKAEVNGLVVNKEQVQKNIEECNTLLSEIETKIYQDELVTSLWKEEEQGHRFDYGKNSDLGKLLYELTGQEKQFTDKGGLALDADTLSKMPYPVTDLIIEARQTLKLRDTYLVNLKKEAVLDERDGDWKLHSFFNLHIAETFRSSSSGGLNTQNLPSRDDRAVKLIKSCIVPQKGRRIIGFDYKALEAAIGACIHKDKNMADFITGGGDMHRKTLLDMFKLTEETVKELPEKTYKLARGFAKKANFSSFYGAAYKSVALKAWKDANYLPEIMAHLKSVKLGTYEDFLQHMKNVCERLWTVQFPVYGEWRKEQYDFYLKHGYVDLIDGFRCWGPLTSMQASNSPIQGPASHCLLWAFSQIDKELTERKLQTYLINEIHDACYISEVPEEHEVVIPLIRKWMVDELPNKFKWVSIPMAAEGEGTALREEGGNWADTVLDLGYI